MSVDHEAMQIWYFFQAYENGNKGLFLGAVSSLQVDVLQSSES